MVSTRVSKWCVGWISQPSTVPPKTGFPQAKRPDRVQGPGRSVLRFSWRLLIFPSGTGTDTQPGLLDEGSLVLVSFLLNASVAWLVERPTCPVAPFFCFPLFGKGSPLNLTNQKGCPVFLMATGHLRRETKQLQRTPDFVGGVWGGKLK